MNEKYCGQQETESGYDYVCTLRGEHEEHRAMDTQGNVIKAWPVRKGPESHGTIWVCQCCMLTHANGECCSLDETGHSDGCEPLSAIEAPFTVAMGMGWADHEDDCLTHVIRDLEARFPDVDWPDVPGDYECECETNTFSTSQCEGCNSYLHGERHAMTLFKG